MAEYIERKKLVNSLKMWLMDLENDMDKGDYGELSENKGAREALESCICEIEEQPVTDVQPVDTKEIIRHLDSLMICVSNAYNTSHYLLESDMEFIEKQEKIIKELLEG